LLACYDPDSDEFQSVCKIGTGFSDEALRDLSTQFEVWLRVKQCILFLVERFSFLISSRQYLFLRSTFLKTLFACPFTSFSSSSPGACPPVGRAAAQAVQAGGLAGAGRVLQSSENLGNPLRRLVPELGPQGRQRQARHRRGPRDWPPVSEVLAAARRQTPHPRHFGRPNSRHVLRPAERRQLGNGSRRCCRARRRGLVVSP